MNEDNLSQRIHYGFPKLEIRDQPEIVFVFDLETYNDRTFVETFAAGFYDVNRSQNMWETDSTPEEIETETDSVIVFDTLGGNPFMKKLKYFQTTMKEMRELVSINKVMRWSARIGFYD